MQFEGYRRTAPAPNLTPLIDIVFLLLVFFMLTSHFVRDEALEVALPQAQSGTPIEQQDEQLEVVLDASGTILLGGEPVAAEQLELRLREALATRQEKVVRIRGDRAADLGGAVGILDAARAAGAEAVDLVTEGL